MYDEKMAANMKYSLCLSSGQQDVSYLSSRRLGGPERLGVTTGGGRTLPVVALTHLALPAPDELMHICVLALSLTHTDPCIVTLHVGGALYSP